ncbi:hypothetical protein HUN08_09785 [Gordonia sp. X0973]|uniref:hypothetical protein n=1 Tax=Gordonia sp. X0973 TaxID=2742602 RepID=UPI0015817B19|nr:hypothetical protein [Gordonia sp. X0973]QKT07452.1 hypothetical protein HUN08_09785 [Gordonia sp. X0973]
MSFRPTALVTAAATVALVLGLTGCGSGDEHGRPDVPTVAPQTPLPARVPAAPEGTVVAAPTWAAPSR